MQAAISCAQCNHSWLAHCRTSARPFDWAAMSNPGLQPSGADPPCRRTLSGFPRRSLWTPAPPLVLQSPRHFKPASDMTRTPAREGPGPANSRTNKRSADVRPHGKGGVDAVIHENARAPDANLSQKLLASWGPGVVDSGRESFDHTGRLRPRTSSIHCHMLPWSPND